MNTTIEMEGGNLSGEAHRLELAARRSRNSSSSSLADGNILDNSGGSSLGGGDAFLKPEEHSPSPPSSSSQSKVKDASMSHRTSHQWNANAGDHYKFTKPVSTCKDVRQILYKLY